jgi:hypothetical protein
MNIYSPTLPSGNMILVSEYIFIFPEPACYKCFIISNETKKTHTCKILFKINIHILAPRKTHRFSRQSYRSLTGKRQRHSERITCRRPLQFVVDVVFKCLRQRSNGLSLNISVLAMFLLSLHVERSSYEVLSKVYCNSPETRQNKHEIKWKTNKMNLPPHICSMCIKTKIKIIFHPLGSLVGFPARVVVLWQENVRGTRNASLAGDRYNLLWMWLLSDNEFNIIFDEIVEVILYIYCMLVREIWTFIHPRVSYSLRAT